MSRLSEEMPAQIGASGLSSAVGGWSFASARPGEPIQRWTSRAGTIAEIERELARIWSIPRLVAVVAGVEERHVAARTSVLNLVVIARRPETAERCADTVRRLTGRHPSRTLVVLPADPDGPAWLDARITAHCVLPGEDTPETCAEMITVTAGGETGRHPAAIIAPLVIHDLPVTVWWSGDVPFRSDMAADVLEMADRLVVDGSTWSGDGLDRLRALAALAERPTLAVWDFALVRQSRWREAIASVFDHPDFMPFLRAIRRMRVTFATHDPAGSPGSANIVKPVYHLAWLASRLGLRVDRPLTASGPDGGLVAALRRPAGDVEVAITPVSSAMPAGTTLEVEVFGRWRGSELRAAVSAEAETVHPRVWLNGRAELDRVFRSPRRTDVNLLAEVLEASGRDRIATDAIAMAGALAGP